MSRTSFERLILSKSLALVDDPGLQEFGEKVISAGHFDAELKNVCTKVAPELADRLDNVCKLLGVSKRSFCEGAFLEALDKADAIMKAEGVYDFLKRLHADSAKSEQEIAA